MSKKNKANSEVEVWKKYKSVRLSKTVRDVILNNGIVRSGIRDRTEAKLRELQQFVSEMYLVHAGGKDNVVKHINFIKKMEELAIDAQPYGYSSLVCVGSAKIAQFRVCSSQLPDNKGLGAYLATFKGDFLSTVYYSPNNLNEFAFDIAGACIGFPGRTAFPKFMDRTSIDLEVHSKANDDTQVYIKRYLQLNAELLALYEEHEDIRRNFQTILNNSGSTKRLLQQMPEALKLIPDYILEGMSPPQLPALLIADTAKKLNL